MYLYCETALFVSLFYFSLHIICLSVKSRLNKPPLTYINFKPQNILKLKKIKPN